MPAFDIEDFENGKTLVTDLHSGAKGLFDSKTGAPLKGDIKGHLSTVLEQEAMDLASVAKNPEAVRAMQSKISMARNAGGLSRLTILRNSVGRMIKGGLPSMALGILADEGDAAPRNIEEAVTRNPKYVKKHGA